MARGSDSVSTVCTKKRLGGDYDLPLAYSVRVMLAFFDDGTSKGMASHRRVFDAFKHVFQLPIDEPFPVSFSHDRVSSVNTL